jgi:hypothetical protein
MPELPKLSAFLEPLANLEEQAATTIEGVVSQMGLPTPPRVPGPAAAAVNMLKTIEESLPLPEFTLPGLPLPTSAGTTESGVDIMTKLNEVQEDINRALGQLRIAAAQASKDTSARKSVRGEVVNTIEL